MRYSGFFFLISFAGWTLASDFAFDIISRDTSNLELRQDGCGTPLGKCNKNGCDGYNDPVGSQSFCLAGGTIAGCPCEKVCGDPGPCDKAGCAGINDFEGGFGICTEGDFKGCTCTSICGGVMESCNKNGCEGTNAPGGLPGICTAGAAMGCLCTSICGAESGPCSASSCGGNDEGVCTIGSLRGCPCIKDNASSCKNLGVLRCSESPCNGVINDEDGFGICAPRSKVAGCPCVA